MQFKISVIRCPECGGMLSYSLTTIQCKCGYIVEKRKNQTEVKKS